MGMMVLLFHPSYSRKLIGPVQLGEKARHYFQNNQSKKEFKLQYHQY
jgi:hypothetical protein